jgi:hypothetical protein
VLCLLPSPFLGPAVWRPAAALLAADGWPVAEVPLSGRPPRTTADAQSALLTAIPPGPEIVLIPHSNAGLYVPILTTARNVAGFVFTDAVLPGRRGRIQAAPPGLLTMLADRADGDGMLPPWTRWWEEDISELFPSEAVRAEVEREEQRIPLSYCTGSVEIPSGWDERPGAYLAFGETYAAERTAAAERGWPVRTLRGDHLHMLVDPAETATAIAELLREIGVG